MKLRNHGPPGVWQRLSRAGKLAVLCLAAAGVLHAGGGTNALPAAVCSNAVASAELPGGSRPANAATNDVSAPVLPLWVEQPTNAVCSDWPSRAGATNAESWRPPGDRSLLSTGSPWRTTATLETGFFHARHAGCYDGPGYDRRSVDGWF